MADYDYDAVVYDNYDTKGISPYEILQQMNSWNKELRFTISDSVEGLETKIELLSGEIRLEVTDEINRIDAQLVVQAGLINARVTQVDFDEVNQRLFLAEGTLSVLPGQINSKASTTVVDAIGTRVSTAEQSINSMTGTISQKVSLTDYNGNTIASMINQSATTVSIQASKILLVGAVAVLSDITGNLGTITSGNINIYNEIRVGGGIYMRSSAFKVLRMGEDPIDYGSLSVNGGVLTIDAGNSIQVVSPINFNNVSVSGLNVTAKWG